jgi:hypothetical protein
MRCNGLVLSVMAVPISTLSLDAWGDIAQFVIAIAGVLALLGAAAQVRLSRVNARRARVYEYADRFNQRQMLRSSAAYMDAWENDFYESFKALDRADRLEWMMLPNLIEEVAFLYNRKLLDRNVAAEILGIYVERLWTVSIPLVSELRREKNRPSLFSEWEEMQRDTPARQMKAIRKAERRRARRRLLRGD